MRDFCCSTELLRFQGAPCVTGKVLRDDVACAMTPLDRLGKDTGIQHRVNVEQVRRAILLYVAIIESESVAYPQPGIGIRDAWKPGDAMGT